MKKLTFILAAALWALAAGNVSAQLSDGSHFGFVGGFTSSAAKVSDFDVKNISLYHAGMTMKINLGLGFAIQPSVLYQVKGATVNEVFTSDVETTKNQFDYKFGFVEVPVQFQWGPDLVAFRPYVFAEPFVGYGVTSEANAAFRNAMKKDNETQTLDESKNAWRDYGFKRFEYGLGFGGGIEIWRFQISAEYFWNFGDMVDENGDVKPGIIGDNVKDAFKGKKSFNGIKVSLGLLF